VSDKLLAIAEELEDDRFHWTNDKVLELFDKSKSIDMKLSEREEEKSGVQQETEDPATSHLNIATPEPTKNETFVFKRSYGPILDIKKKAGKKSSSSSPSSKPATPPLRSGIASSHEGWADWLRTKTVGVADGDFASEMLKISEEVEALWLKKGSKKEEKEEGELEESPALESKTRDMEEKAEKAEEEDVPHMPGLFLGKRDGGRY
jgi:hypothetical protein